MFKLFARNSDPLTARGLVQKHGDRYLIHNPPALPLTPKELDHVYELPYKNDVHPYDKRKGKVRAIQAVANQVFENAMSGKETSAIFFLKNRDPENWSDRAEVNHNLNLKEVLNIAKNRVIEGSVDYNKLSSQHVLTKDTLPED